MGRISKYRRYVIDITRLDPPHFGELGGVQCFGEFGASEHARMVKIGRRIMDLHKLT